MYPLMMFDLTTTSTMTPRMIDGLCKNERGMLRPTADYSVLGHSRNCGILTQKMGLKICPILSTQAE
jgi:hypothetical protein